MSASNPDSRIYSSPLTPHQAEEFRAYWATDPTIADTCAKYRITRLRARAILAELGLEISTGRPQKAKSGGIHIHQDEFPLGGSIADRFRPQGLTKLSPHR
jgi:hypothetical protein